MHRHNLTHNPLLRVSRPVSACSRCRSAKVKCDGKLPACTACEKAGRQSECSSANDNFARGKERSYVAALEAAIDKLDKQLAMAKATKAHEDGQDGDGSANEKTAQPLSPQELSELERRDSMAKIANSVRRKAAKERENDDINAVISDLNFLTINATVRDFDPQMNLTFAQFLLSAACSNDLPEPGPDDFELPPRQEAQSIIRFFMTNVFSLFPCVKETVLLTAIDDIYSQDERVMDASDYWLVYMVLAIGSAAQSKTLQDSHAQDAIKFISKALDYADEALALDAAHQLRSLILLTIYSELDPVHFDSWYVVGFAARVAIDLGYHQDPRNAATAEVSNLDLRRKLFWCVYALDRNISMVHFRPLSFSDDAMNVAFPKFSGSERKAITGPQSSDPALVLFQLRTAQSFWYQELYLKKDNPLPRNDPIAFVWQMCLEMREWGESLPQGIAPGTRKMFEQELMYSYVYCLAPSVRIPNTSDYNKCLLFKYTQEYLDMMHEVAHASLNSALYTYHDALKVLFTANQLLGILREAETMLLYGPRPQQPLVAPGYPPPPPSGLPSGCDRMTVTARTLLSLERASETLGKFAERWDRVNFLKNTFEGIGRSMIEHLRTRKTEEEAGLINPSQQYQKAYSVSPANVGHPQMHIPVVPQPYQPYHMPSQQQQQQQQQQQHHHLYHSQHY